MLVQLKNQHLSQEFRHVYAQAFYGNVRLLQAQVAQCCIMVALKVSSLFTPQTLLTLLIVIAKKYKAQQGKI